MSGATTYVPRNNYISWGEPLTGLANGTFVTIEPVGQVASYDEPGPDGEVGLNIGSDRRYNIKVTFKKGSPSNTILSRAAASTRNGIPVIRQFKVIDDSTGRSFIGDNTVITDEPPWESMTGEFGNAQWTFQCSSGRVDHKGRA